LRSKLTHKVKITDLDNIEVPTNPNANEFADLFGNRLCTSTPASLDESKDSDPSVVKR
jgi:hypothetical protein